MGQAQINVRTRACSRTSIARTKQAVLTHNVMGKELNFPLFLRISSQTNCALLSVKWNSDDSATRFQCSAKLISLCKVGNISLQPGTTSEMLCVLPVC